MLALYAETRKILMSGIMETTFLSGPFFYAPGDAASNLDELYVRLAELQYAKKPSLMTNLLCGYTLSDVATLGEAKPKPNIAVLGMNVGLRAVPPNLRERWFWQLEKRSAFRHQGLSVV
ncbi:hypothetical protein LPB16_00545 [Salmonella enterica subsp. enterica]